jgi:membrane protein insertase Oxa1/YidC/SpoIIIJ
LDVQKTAPNGYYVLILLSIGTILLQQFVSMRSQKAQNKYSTVDGQGASQQKMMMFMMTAMFAFFSFMYSGAFSIYLVVSNVFSLASTLIINKVVDGIMEKKSLQETITKYDNRMLSRIEAAKNSGRESAKESREKKMEKAVEPKKETTPPQTTENKPEKGAETNETVEGDKEQGE